MTISIGPVLQGVLANVDEFVGSIRDGPGDLLFHDQRGAVTSRAVRLGLDPDATGHRPDQPLTEDVRKYMTVLTGVNFLVGLGDTIFLWFLGVDFAVLWGLLAWFMGYIPSIGFMIALIPPVLLAYAQYGLQTAVVVLIGYIVINGGVQNFYQPKVMGERLKISPVVVFVGLFIWGYLLGGIGATPGGSAYLTGADHHGEFRRHKHPGDFDALHR